MFGLSVLKAWDRRLKHLFAVALLALPALAGVACIQIQREPDTVSASDSAHVVVPILVQTQTPSPTATPVPDPPGPTVVPTPTQTSTPSPTREPTATATPAALSSADVFGRISPSVAFIQTSTGTGSGVLIDGGYVVTNAHVVWPFDSVRVVFPDGTEHLAAPVANWDLMADLAVIGPIDSAVSAIELVDGEDLTVGSDVFLIGYPGEVQEFPQPTITRGIISRIREWDPIQMTYFQTDAAIAGGQSGGVLVSDKGEVIGISGFRFTEAGFGIVASAADLIPLVHGLVRGSDTDNLGNRALPMGQGDTEHDITLQGYWDRRVFVLNEPPGTEVYLTVSGDTDAILAVGDVYGTVMLLVDETPWGMEAASFTTSYDAPTFVVVGHRVEGVAEVRLTSSRPLSPLVDDEDGKAISVGDIVAGNADYPGDLDYFVIDLEKDQAIEVLVSSALLNPIITIDFVGATEDQLIADDNSGGGLFGLDPLITYRAPHTGSYNIVVESAEATIGGYFLVVGNAPPDAVAFSPPPSATALPDATVGEEELTTYTSDDFPFSFQYPAAWTQSPGDPAYGISASFTGPENESAFVTVEDLVETGLGEMGLDEYKELILTSLVEGIPGFRLLSERDLTNGQGLPIVLLEFTNRESKVTWTRLVYLHENAVGVNVTYGLTSSRHEELKGLIDLSLSTFELLELSGAAAPQGSVVETLTAFVHPDDIYSVSYPTGWVSGGLQSDNHPQLPVEAVMFSSPLSEAFSAVSVDRLMGWGPRELVDWSSNELDLVERGSTAFRLISWKRVFIDGLLAYEAVLFNSKDGFDFARIELHIIVGDDRYVVRGITEQKSWAEQEPLLREAVYSFRIPRR